MKKFKYIFIIFIITITLLNFDVITSSIKLSFDVCIKSLLPSIIPFLLLSNIIIKCNFFNKNSFSLIILCILSGSPSSSKYLKNYYDNKLINYIDLQKLLNYLQYFNPIYILNGVGLMVLNDKRLGLIVLISNIISSFLLKKKTIIKESNTCNSFSLFELVSSSIRDLISILLYIIGVITTFFIFTSYIDIIFNVDIKYKYLYGFIEVTQGINYLKYSDLNTFFKTIISSVFISFGGISMHVQIFGILDNKKIRYKPYLIARIKHSILSCILTSTLFYILY